MALKDWRKVTENNIFTTYQKKPDKDMFVTIVKQTYNCHAWGYNKKTDYIFSVGTHSVKIKEKHFKTKTRAKIYAEKYMEKNNGK